MEALTQTQRSDFVLTRGEAFAILTFCQNWNCVNGDGGEGHFINLLGLWINDSKRAQRKNMLTDMNFTERVPTSTESFGTTHKSDHTWLLQRDVNGAVRNMFHPRKPRYENSEHQWEPIQGHIILLSPIFLHDEIWSLTSAGVLLVSSPKESSSEGGKRRPWATGIPWIFLESPGHLPTSPDCLSLSFLSLSASTTLLCDFRGAFDGERPVPIVVIAADLTDPWMASFSFFPSPGFPFSL